MSDDPLAQRRMSTRSAHRLNQEAASALDSDTSSSATSPSESLSTNTSASPKLEPKLELKEEHSYTEPPSSSVGSETTLSSVVLQAIPVQTKDTLGLTQLGPNTFTGRKRKANFSNEETETLVRDVVKNFSALYGTEALRTESTRRNQRRSQLWTQIQKHVNELGYTPRTIDDLKHKWRDLRLEVKRKITHRKASGKGPPAPGVTPIIDTKLTPLEDLVASTIGHHCTLDGEQEGMFMEPGVPRQSIFFSCRGPSDLAADRLGSTASPRPAAEISLVSPLVSNSPARLSFLHVSDDGENEEQEMDVTQTVTVKPFSEAWSAVGEVCALVTAPSDLAPAPKKLIIAKPEILTVKRELAPIQTGAETGRSDSSPEGSLSRPAGQTEWAANGNNPVETGDTIVLKVEDESGSRGTEEENSPPQDPARSTWQENQDEWERQSGSPQPSENAQEDSLRSSSSSQEGEPSSGGEAATNGDCACMPHEHKGQWRTNMHRLLELEEQWDSMYHKEIGMWEEEREQQREQRAQDRELQQQLLAVLTDIRDELRQIREERVTARQNQAAPPNSSNSPPPQEKPSDSGADTPAAKTPKPAPVGSPPSGKVKRRGRPRLNRPKSSNSQS